MTAVLVFVLFGCIGAFGWACWRAGVERGIAECEGRVTLALRLQEAERQEIARKARIEMGSDLLGALGENWRTGAVIDLRDGSDR